MQIQTTVRRCLVTGVTAACATWFATGTASAIQDVQLTTVRGNASLADVALTGRSELAEDKELMTGDDGNASVLLDRNAVVELCGQSQVRFSRDKEKGTRIVTVKAGEVKLIVEPRNAGERIEIHTPAAIATILGTVVYVSVDPVTGATTISSSQSQVNIRSVDDSAGSGTTISAYEQLTIVPGEQMQEKKTIDKEQVATMASCLLDFHDIAVGVDRIPQETKAVERVAIADVGSADLPPIASGRAAGPVLEVVADPGETEGEPEVDIFEPGFQDPEGLLPPPLPTGLRNEAGNNR